MSISCILKAENQFGFSLGCSKTLTLTRMISMVLTAGSGWRFLRLLLVPEHRRLLTSKNMGASTYRCSTRKHVGKVKSVMIGKRNLPATSAPWCRNCTLLSFEEQTKSNQVYLVYSVFSNLPLTIICQMSPRPLQPFSSEFPAMLTGIPYVAPIV